VAARAESIQFHGGEAIGLQAPDGSKVVVMRQGAQVVSWVSAAGVEQLYLSPQARWGPGQAVRGGIPVLFPQVGERGPGPRHGLARTADWSILNVHALGDEAQVTLALTSTPQTLSLWPHAFRCELSVQLTPNVLRLFLRVANTGDSPCTFTAALHSYLQVGELDSVVLAGLHRVPYEDALQAAPRVVDRGAILRVNGALDRIYFDVPGKLQLTSDNGSLNWYGQGFNDAVVWNPGPHAAAALVDLPSEGYRQFLCIEAAAIGCPVRQERGDQWYASQTLIAV
jgi:glucose-6-phosphate 1-epimerase